MYQFTLMIQHIRSLWNTSQQRPGMISHLYFSLKIIIVIQSQMRGKSGWCWQFVVTWVHVVCHVFPFPLGWSLTSWPRRFRSLGRGWRHRGFKYTACVEPWSVIIMNFHGNEPLTTEFLLVFGDQEKPCPSYYGKDEDKKKVKMVL